MLEERFDLYNQFIALENSANNPSRLFQNRGGKLLQEEKTRKKIVSVCISLLLFCISYPNDVVI